MVFSVPGSQIECERVFSLAGLIASSRRNRMCHDNLALLVFLKRNIHLDGRLKGLLEKMYGSLQYELVAGKFKSVSELEMVEEELEYCAGELDPLNCGRIHAVVDEEEPLIRETEYVFHSLAPSGQWV
mmetsp:Transcript_12990/g.36528  ORF Transcript_12990/g.36528 Transcript_12990/m.36528 type:complete len:128 (-) Transcript_12990:13-396(-)